MVDATFFSHYFLLLRAHFHVGLPTVLLYPNTYPYFFIRFLFCFLLYFRTNLLRIVVSRTRQICTYDRVLMLLLLLLLLSLLNFFFFIFMPIHIPEADWQNRFERAVFLFFTNKISQFQARKLGSHISNFEIYLYTMWVMPEWVSGCIVVVLWIETENIKYAQSHLFICLFIGLFAVLRFYTISV